MPIVRGAIRHRRRAGRENRSLGALLGGAATVSLLLPDRQRGIPALRSGHDRPAIQEH